MRQASLVFGLFILMSILLAFPVAADEKTENLVSVVLDDFDTPDQSNWVVVGSKFATEGFPKMAFPTAWPEALYGANKEGKDYKVLGVWGKFDRQGYNYIELIPDRKNEDGEYIGIPIPGRVKMLDVWVWGSQYDYYMEAHVMDYRGFTHVLNLGSLKYEGWRNLKALIPVSIPQGRKYVPQIEPLSLMKLVIWTRPQEKVDNFYIYVDYVKILTDTFITRFDGESLADPDVVNEIWGSADSSGSNTSGGGK